MMPEQPRIDLVPVADYTPEQLALAGGPDSNRRELNLVRTMVNHPKLYKAWIPFAEELVFGSNLPMRDREILILRTSELCGEHYEAAHHVQIARTAGLSEADYQAAKGGGAGLLPFEAALARAADELVADSRIADATWATLAEHYDKRQMIEVVMVVGNYVLLSMMTNSFDVAPETDVAGAWKPF